MTKTAEDQGRTNQEAPKVSGFSSLVVKPVTEQIVVENWMQHSATQTAPVNANELTSLTALIAYVGYSTGQNEFRIERQLSDRFNVPNVKCLPTQRYDEAIRYLVEQVPAKVAASN